MTTPKRPEFAVSLSRQPFSEERAPHVAGAEAAEAAIMKQLEARVGAGWPEMQALLQRPGMHATRTSDPKLSELLTQYYEAHQRTVFERYRQREIDVARMRGGVFVTIVLGESNGTKIMRRPINNPAEIIVLGRNATTETLDAALQAARQVTAALRR